MKMLRRPSEPLLFFFSFLSPLFDNDAGLTFNLINQLLRLRESVENIYLPPIVSPVILLLVINVSLIIMYFWKIFYVTISLLKKRYPLSQCNRFILKTSVDGGFYAAKGPGSPTKVAGSACPNRSPAPCSRHHL